MGHLKPKKNLFFSYYCRKKGVVSRRLVEVVNGRGVKRNVSLRVTRPSRGYLPAKLRNVCSVGADIAEIMEAVNKGYLIPQGNLAVAALLHIGDRKKVWINPGMQAILEKVQSARRERRICENNGARQSTINFWTRLEGLYELGFLNHGIATRATTAMVEAEINNFLRGFDVRL